MGSEHPNIVPYGSIFITRDGREFVVAVGTERQFLAFVAALGLDELAQDPRYSSNGERVRNRSALNARIGERVAALLATEIEAAMTARKVPFGFVNDMAAVFEQPAARAQCFTGGAGVRTVALEGDMEGLSALTPPPQLDADRAAVLAWLDSAS
jgi:crotonobetainyl-CoA:carnitine CoA-transferase CaiB-like acyl-CoA transferase